MSSNIERYNVNNHSVSEKYKPTDPNELKELAKPYSQRMLEQMNVKIIESTEEQLTFDLTGVDASTANSIRRIMLSEVPTVAIENVYIEMNSSIIHDEVLAHRLGLIPIKVDPRLFEFKGEGDANSANTLVFSLDVKCDWSQDTSEHNDGSAPYTMSVYSSSLVWCPQGDQEETFGVDGVRPVHEDILLAKLRPGQSIKLEAHCEKGVGKDHAKFSPVATASYRLLPAIDLQPMNPEESKQLVDLCPMNVFDIEDMGITVARPRDCSVCRECIRLEGWSEKVSLSRVPDHFIFKVETIGMLTPRQIVSEALRILREKCETFLSIVDGSTQTNEDEGSGGMEDDIADILS